jgi:hypothetical protein
MECYTGPIAALGIGPCGTGSMTCSGDGAEFGACEGEVVPVEENPSTPIDDDCDGQINEAS